MGDAASLVSDTLDSDSFNPARSSAEPSQLVYEKVYPTSTGLTYLEPSGTVPAGHYGQLIRFPVVG
jgi:hypothetical protein